MRNGSLRQAVKNWRPAESWQAHFGFSISSELRSNMLLSETNQNSVSVLLKKPTKRKMTTCGMGCNNHSVMMTFRMYLTYSNKSFLRPRNENSVSDLVLERPIEEVAESARKWMLRRWDGSSCRCTPFDNFSFISMIRSRLWQTRWLSTIFYSKIVTCIYILV